MNNNKSILTNTIDLLNNPIFMSSMCYYETLVSGMITFLK